MSDEINCFWPMFVALIAGFIIGVSVGLLIADWQRLGTEGKERK